MTPGGEYNTYEHKYHRVGRALHGLALEWHIDEDMSSNFSKILVLVLGWPKFQSLPALGAIPEKHLQSAKAPRNILTPGPGCCESGNEDVFPVVVEVG